MIVSVYVSVSVTECLSESYVCDDVSLQGVYYVN